MLKVFHLYNKKRKPTAACLRIRLEGATLFVRYGNEEVNIRRINHTNKQTTESKYQPQTVLSSSVATIPRFVLLFLFGKHSNRQGPRKPVRCDPSPREI